jgi:hypothetical protein
MENKVLHLTCGAKFVIFSTGNVLSFLHYFLLELSFYLYIFTHLLLMLLEENCTFGLGNNEFGQLGNGTKDSSILPIKILKV